MDRNPAVVTMAEFNTYQPGLAALTVRTQQRSFSSFNSMAGGGSPGGLNIMGLAVTVGLIVLVAHLARGRK